MLFFIHFRIQTPKGVASDMTEPINSKLLMAQLGACHFTVLPGKFVCQSQLLETGQGEISHWTVDTKVGVETLFTESEEKLLVDHVKYMASLGFGYDKLAVLYMARDDLWIGQLNPRTHWAVHDFMTFLRDRQT